MTVPAPVTPGQLAQSRGCEAWNDCYPACCEEAQQTIDRAAAGDPTAQDEVADAAAWAATQRWADAGGRSVPRGTAP